MRPFIAIVLTSVFAAAASVGCSFQAKEGSGTGPIGPTYDGSINLDRVFTSQDVTGTTGGADSLCPANTFTASNLPPDLLIVLDRSGSMLEDPMTGMSQPTSPTNKWAQTTTALNQVVGQTQDKIRWGLKFFGSPGGGACGVNDMAEVPVGPMNAAAIAAAIATGDPGSNTPTRAAVTQAAAYLRTVTDLNPKFILLATDGQPNCRTGGGGGGSATDDAAAIAAVATVAAMGFPTFVIGIATTGTAGHDTLSMMAVNGGYPRTGDPRYYPVTTSADLATALGIIQGMIALPCQFQLGGVPQDLNAVTVTVGGQPVVRPDWMYAPGNRAIIFPEAGATCMGLKSGALKDVIIKLPCGINIIP
ncbi:MAG: VWA domain-containing protein [Deltaproteobacteria bacterium]|nr:VWA domain-containing protein [Deltaproteobacteria bacterium]